MATRFPKLYPCVVEEPYLLRIPKATRILLAWSVCIAIASLYYVLPALVVLSCALTIAGHWRSAACILAVLLAGALVPMQERPAARRFFQILYELFDVKHNISEARCRRDVEASVERGDRFILGMHPHGVVPLQALIWAAYADQYLRTPEHGTLYGFGGMASVILYLPVLRTLMGWLTGVPATFATLKAGLTTGTGATFRGAHPGRNLYMLPGGLAEIFTAKPRTHVVVWRARRGLVRLALLTGARLTPMYVFGGADFYHQGLTSDSRLSRACRRAGLACTLFWGRAWYLPTVPLQPAHGVTIALAEPLPSVRAAAADGRPTEAEIDELHAAYEAALRQVFDEYKAAAGYPEGELVVQ